MRGLVLTLVAVATGFGSGISVAAVGSVTPAASQVVSLRGRVVFEGTPVAGAPAMLSADPFCAGAHDEPLVITPVATDSEGGLADVVIWVENAPRDGAPPEEPALLDQVGCVYLPHALAVRAGQTVVFRNSDQTLHNINVQPEANPAFNVGQPIAGMETRRTFEGAEVGIPVRCDVHPWMTGSISVFDHAWFAVTDGSGRFELVGMPPGEWTLTAWHAELGSVTMEATVGADAPVIELRYHD